MNNCAISMSNAIDDQGVEDGVGLIVELNENENNQKEEVKEEEVKEQQQEEDEVDPEDEEADLDNMVPESAFWHVSDHAL